MRASIALIDLRRLSLSRPSKYRRNAPRCATWPKRSLRTAPATCTTDPTTPARCVAALGHSVPKSPEKYTRKSRLVWILQPSPSLHRIRIRVTDPAALVVVDVGLRDELNVAGPLDHHHEVGAAALR